MRVIYMRRDGKTVQAGNYVVAKWGGVCQGVQRMTRGYVEKVTRTGRVVIAPNKTRSKRAHVHANDCTAILDGKLAGRRWTAERGV